MLTTKTPFEGREFDEVESWFGTQYCSFDIPIEWLDKWKDPPILADFAPPEPNVYIPKDLTVLFDPNTMKLAKYPEKIFENELCELWHRQDDRFLLPTACYYFYFTTEMSRGSIEK